MTCAKRHVTCRLVLKCGSVILASNYCEEPQHTCPRAPGEGYAKCDRVCRQPGHAEVNAVTMARRRGLDTRGGILYLSGIDWICNHCRAITEGAGIARIYIQ